MDSAAVCVPFLTKALVTHPGIYPDCLEAPLTVHVKSQVPAAVEQVPNKVLVMGDESAPTASVHRRNRRLYERRPNHRSVQDRMRTEDVQPTSGSLVTSFSPLDYVERDGNLDCDNPQGNGNET